MEFRFELRASALRISEYKEAAPVFDARVQIFEIPARD
jgi:hypothetical protein